MKSALEDIKRGLRWRIKAANEMMCPEEVFLRQGHLNKDMKGVPKEGTCGNLGNQAKETTCVEVLRQDHF